MRRALLLLALLAFCAGCSTVPGENAPVRVGLLLSSMEKERYHKDRAAFTRRVEELGGAVAFDSAGGDSQSQRKVGRDLLESGIRALVVQVVDREAALALVEEAHRAGVPIVAYDRMVSGVPFDWAVVHDSAAVGRAQAEYAVRALGSKGGQVAILKGKEGNPVAEAITRANLEVLKDARGIEVVEVVGHGRWIPEESARTTRRLLKEHPRLRAILANNSALARGAVEVLREAGRAGEVYVAGADADLTNCQWVATGLQGMDVLKELGPLATGAADVAVALARGEDPTPKVSSSANRVVREGSVPTLVLPVTPFDRTNLEEVVVGTGFHPRAALFPGTHSPGTEGYPGE